MESLKNNSNDYNSNHIHYTSTEIKECRKTLDGIIIAPFIEKNAKGVGYNLSLSEMIYSVTKKQLVSIHHNANESFFYLKPYDSVLALSYEFIETNNCTAGTFHSRVRATTQGIGCISTTLDPGWKGMLLFSLTNSTQRKIKVVLSTKINGESIPNPIITLVAYQTPKDASINSYLDLNLDNPPMRGDIWSELISKPLRLFRNSKYQKFRKLVEEISNFNCDETEKTRWIKQLSDLLKELRIAIIAYNSKETAKEVLIKIESFIYTNSLKGVNDLPYQLTEKLQKLTLVLKDDALDILNSENFLYDILQAENELKYQYVCECISQIHIKIHNQIPFSWHGNFVAKVWDIIKSNFATFIATIIAIFFIILSLHNKTLKFLAVITATMPLLFSALKDFHKKHY